MLTTGLAAIDSTVVATALPSIVRDLGGFSLFAWVFSVYVLFTAVTTPVYSKLSDLFGRRPMLVIGTILFLTGSVLCGISWSMTTLIIARGIQGLGAGALQTISQTVIGDLYTVAERGRVSGYMSSVWGISSLVGPALGGLLSEYVSWRWIFYINVPIGLGALAMVLRHFHEQVHRSSHRIDVEGGVLLVGWTGLLVLGLLSGGVQWSWLSVPSVAVLGGAVVCLVGFVWFERRAAEPMLPAWIFRHRALAGATASSLCVGLATIGLSTFLPTYAQSVLGASAVRAGFVVAVMSIGWPIAATLANRLYLRIGFRNASLFGVLLMAIAAYLFITLTAASSLWHLAFASLMAGFGFGLITNPMMVGIQSVVGWRRRGVVTGASMFARAIGSALGAALFGLVANTVLVHWFATAPASVRAQLPTSLDDASKLLAGGGHASAPVLEFVRTAMFEAVHSVLWLFAAITVLALVTLLWTPAQFEEVPD